MPPARQVNLNALCHLPGRSTSFSEWIVFFDGQVANIDFIHEAAIIFSFNISQEQYSRSMVVIRLSRGGVKKRPFYKIVVTDSRKRRDSAFVERIGYFNPIARGQEQRLFVQHDRVEYWRKQGVQMSERVRSLIKQSLKTNAVTDASKENAVTDASKENAVTDASKENAVTDASKENAVTDASKENAVADAS